MTKPSSKPPLDPYRVIGTILGSIGFLHLIVLAGIIWWCGMNPGSHISDYNAEQLWTIAGTGFGLSCVGVCLYNHDWF